MELSAAQHGWTPPGWPRLRGASRGKARQRKGLSSLLLNYEVRQDTPGQGGARQSQAERRNARQGFQFVAARHCAAWSGVASQDGARFQTVSAAGLGLARRRIARLSAASRRKVPSSQLRMAGLVPARRRSASRSRAEQGIVTPLFPRRHNAQLGMARPRHAAHGPATRGSHDQ